MVAHLMEDCHRARENILNHVKTQLLHPQRRTGIEHTSQKGHTNKLTPSKIDKKRIKTLQDNNKNNKLMEKISMMIQKTKPTNTQAACIRKELYSNDWQCSSEESQRLVTEPRGNMKVQTRNMIM
jgi:hypothetical protein